MGNHVRPFWQVEAPQGHAGASVCAQYIGNLPDFMNHTNGNETEQKNLNRGAEQVLGQSTMGHRRDPGFALELQAYSEGQPPTRMPIDLQVEKKTNIIVHS